MSWSPVCSLTSLPTVPTPAHLFHHLRLLAISPTWQASCSLRAQIIIHCFIKYTRQLKITKLYYFLWFLRVESWEWLSWVVLMAVWEEGSLSLWLQSHLKTQLGENPLLSSLTGLLAGHRSSWIFGLRTSIPSWTLARHWSVPQLLATWASL